MQKIKFRKMMFVLYAIGNDIMEKENPLCVSCGKPLDDFALYLGLRSCSPCNQE